MARCAYVKFGGAEKAEVFVAVMVLLKVNMRR
jgi:hypothetical protein